jgi:hypothetical protein
MAEEYVKVFLDELENNKEAFENEKSEYEKVKALVTTDIKSIEEAIKPITEYISSHYSTISYVRQIDGYEQLNVYYKEDLLFGYHFQYDKTRGEFFINMIGKAGGNLTVKCADNQCTYVSDEKEMTMQEIIDSHVKLMAEYVAEDNYRIK